MEKRNNRILKFISKIFLSCMMVLSFILSYSTNVIASDIEAEEIYGAILDEKKSNDTESPSEPAEGYDFLNGIWQVGGIDYDYRDNPARNMIVDTKDSDGLTDLYDGVFLSFFADGTFVYMNLFIHEGTYTAHPKNPGCYILKTERSYRLTYEDGELNKVESEGAKSSYYLEICDDSLHFQDYDPFTGKAKANDNGLYFVKTEDESSFIQQNKAEIKTDTDKEQSADNNIYASLSSYSGILEIYSEKMEKAVPGLVNEYKNESAGVHDITRLAEICNDKVGNLADICNEGVGLMADLMYKNGDSYDIYSGWAEKLMNNYMDIAQEIQNAYMDSAI